MDFAKALTFPFEDADWVKKLGIGVAITLGMFLLSWLLLIPLIVGAALFFGWSYEISRRVKNNEATPLPDWDFGPLLQKGFVVWGASVVYQIPTLLFACVMSFIWLLPALGAGDENAMAGLTGLAGIIVLCCGCIIVLYAIAASIVFAGGYVRFLDQPEFGTFMQFGDNLALVRENIGDFAMVALYYIGLSFLVSIVSSVTAGLAGLVAPVVQAYFIGHLIGQLAIKLKGGAPAV